MISFLQSVFSSIAAVLSGAFLAIVAPFSFLFPPAPVPVVTPIATSTAATTTVSTAATSSLPVALPVQKPPVKPPVTVPKPPVTPAPPAVTPPVESVPIGTTTLAVALVPLLSGGVTSAGESVPISYLQIMNIGTHAARLTGFTLKQIGTLPDAAIIGLSTIDDKGGSRGLTGGTEGSAPFKNGIAVAPTDALFEPGQMRLFTIKATLGASVSIYTGMKMQIVVTGIESTAAAKGAFPIPGTVWTLR